MNNLHILMLCGAGGTGKSSVTDMLLKMDDENNGHLREHYDAVVALRSTSRKTYARLGISSETAALQSDPSLQLQLQDEIMSDHLTELRNCVDQAKASQGRVLLVVDRSPLDHLSYWVRSATLAPHLSPETIFEKFKPIEEVLDYAAPDQILWAVFPFPVIWKTEDKFRDQNLMKTLEMQMITIGVVSTFAPDGQGWIDHPSTLAHMVFDSVAGRVITLIHMLNNK